MKLAPVSFNWKKDNRHDIGLIADDLNEIYPEFVSKDGEEIEGISYTKLIPVLISSIQELKKTIDEQQLQIDLLTKNNKFSFVKSIKRIFI